MPKLSIGLGLLLIARYLSTAKFGEGTLNRGRAVTIEDFHYGDFDLEL